jgi:hypothetical protein
LARRNAAHCFMGGPKHRKQPERYAQFGLNNVTGKKLVAKNEKRS